MKTIRTLIAPVIIAALAVTGVTAVQAKADTTDVAKVVIGAVAVAALANALSNSSDNKAVTVTNTKQSYAGRVAGNRYPDPRWRAERAREERRLRASSARCLLTYRDHGRPRQLYDRRCLTHRAHALGTPPRQCGVRVVVRGGKNRVAYDPRCLNQVGFWRGRGYDGRYGWHGYGDRPNGQGQTYDDRRNGHIMLGH